MTNYLELDALEPNITIIDNSIVSYYGELPKKGVFVSFCTKPEKRTRVALYQMGLEIALNGYDAIYIPASLASYSFEKGVRDGNGRLFQVLPYSLKNNKPSYSSKALLSGGGIISCFDNEGFSIENLNRAKEIAVMLAKAVIIAEDKKTYRRPFSYVNIALDSGKDIALLYDALPSPFARNLLKEGCPLVHSFSDFLLNPRFVSFSQNKGIYGIEGEFFDIIKIDE